jgi:hypothetical protein
MPQHKLAVENLAATVGRQTENKKGILADAFSFSSVELKSSAYGN